MFLVMEIVQQMVLKKFCTNKVELFINWQIWCNDETPGPQHFQLFVYLFKWHTHAHTAGLSVCVLYLGLAAGVVECKWSLGGLGISTSFVQGLGVVHFVLLHLRVQLRELLVALGGVGEVLDVIVAETKQRQRRPGLRHRWKEERVTSWGTSVEKNTQLTWGCLSTKCRHLQRTRVPAAF